jgi:hypothetical protein
VAVVVLVKQEIPTATVLVATVFLAALQEVL